MTDKETKFIIYHPEEYGFKECPLCKNPYVDDGKAENCLWCEIHKEENE